MRQSTIQLLVTAAAMLSDEQKKALAKGESQTIKLRKGAKAPFKLTVSFDSSVATVSFDPK